MKRALPWLVLSFITLMAGGVIVIVKYMTTYASAPEILILRFMPASLLSLLLLVALFRRNGFGIIRKFWKYFLIREGIAVIGFHYTFIYASKYLPAGNVALVIAIWPVITIFLASFMLSEKITTRKAVGGILAFLGAAVVILLRPGGDGAQLAVSSYDWTRASLILLIAPFAASVVTIISRKYLIKFQGDELPDPFLFTILSRIPSGIFMPLIYFANFSDIDFGKLITGAPLLFWLFILILAFFNSFVGFWLWNWCIQRLQASSAATFNYIQTGVTLLLAWIFLGESIGIEKILGAVAIIAGVLMVNIGAPVNEFERSPKGALP